jgi:hypothetical protein
MTGYLHTHAPTRTTIAQGEEEGEGEGEIRST